MMVQRAGCVSSLATSKTFRLRSRMSPASILPPPAGESKAAEGADGQVMENRVATALQTEVLLGPSDL